MSAKASQPMRRPSRRTNDAAVRQAQPGHVPNWPSPHAWNVTILVLAKSKTHTSAYVPMILISPSDSGKGEGSFRSPGMLIHSSSRTSFVHRAKNRALATALAESQSSEGHADQTAGRTGPAGENISRIHSRTALASGPSPSGQSARNAWTTATPFQLAATASSTLRTGNAAAVPFVSAAVAAHAAAAQRRIVFVVFMSWAPVVPG